MNKELQDKIYSLLARKIAGNATPEELQELDRLLASLPDFKFLHDQLQQFPELNRLQTKDITDQAYAAQYVKILYSDKDGRWTSENPFIAETGGRKSRLSILKWPAVAASLILLLVTLTWFPPKEKEHTGIVANHLPAGATGQESTKSKMTLPDGTIVYLNANSYLEYDNDFNKTDRNVSLTGEAYFDVAHNSQSPFIVHTSRATIKVLGTKFNVKNYSDESWEATLLQGKIEMYLNSRPKDKLQLEPSQKVSVVALKNVRASDKQPEDYKISVTKIKTLDSDIVETAWMADKLVFVDEPLNKIAKDLERAFNIKVKFLSDKAASQQYTGTFKNDDLLKILQILDLSNPIDYELTHNELIIK